MDNFLRVPGTQFRFGLDPLMGLLPGLGDTGSAIVSAMALIAAARRGLPKILLARMSLNILINEAIGIIPIVGDAFSFWFKSNARNYELLKQSHRRARAARQRAIGYSSRSSSRCSVVILLVSLAVSFWLLYRIGEITWRLHVTSRSLNLGITPPGSGSEANGCFPRPPVGRTKIVDRREVHPPRKIALLPRASPASGKRSDCCQRRRTDSQVRRKV